jgi:uncharacterized sporulation protein YeaH/YhbH (DUF444 family)
MAYTIIDRTLNGKRDSVNRQKFLKRIKTQVNEQLRKSVAEGNIEDLVTGQGKKVNVPKKDLKQPTFHHGEGGMKEYIYTGNRKYNQGDRIDRPPMKGGSGSSKQASDSGEGEDIFQVQLTQEEFLDIFFTDCELPDLRETTIAKSDTFESKRAGFSMDGSISQLNIQRTMKQSKGRRIGLHRKSKKRRLEELEIEEARLAVEIADLESQGESPSELIARIEEVRKEAEIFRRKLLAVPFVDDTDMRFNRWEKVPVPVTQAVMFCLMDVSGSMTQWDKEMAKRYFMLLYLFLIRNYKRVDIKFIRHTHVAKEVDQQEFFYSRQTGGTMVSTALKLMSEIIDERYSPSDWNLYCSQASDGENWSNDTAICIEHLSKAVLPIMQYYTYIEIQHQNPANYDSELWKKYESLANVHKNFQMRKVTDASSIYPVFKELFKKK